MKRLVLLFAITASVLMISATPFVESQQISAPADPYTYSEQVWQDSSLQFVTFIYDDLGTIMFEVQDSTGTILEARPATSSEIETYLSNRDRLLKNQALSELQLDPEVGVNYGQWISNREAELLQCETNMSNGQLLNFNDLGVNSQNTMIRETQACVELNAFVLRKVIVNLCDLLTTQDILICEP